MIHSAKHPNAGETVTVSPLTPAHQSLTPNSPFIIEDWWDRVSGGQGWSESAGSGNFAALNYDMRIIGTKVPQDDEVVYGKIDGLGYLVHVSEIKALRWLNSSAKDLSRTTMRSST